jgi:hypothetical protein
MDYCFDTSAINRLLDDPERHVIVTGLLSANRVLITALNIIEAAATADPLRRQSLLRLQKQLAGGFRPLRTPTDLLRALTLAYHRGIDSAPLTIDETRADIWWAMTEPENLTEEEQARAYEAKQKLESSFSKSNQFARSILRGAFRRDELPRTAGSLIRFFAARERPLLPTTSAVHEKLTGSPLSLDDMYRLFVALPEWPLYLAGFAQGIYAGAVQEQNYSASKNPGTIDLGFAVYLVHSDFLVTNDIRQRKALRIINALSPRRPRARVMTFDQIRRRLLL